MTEGVIVLPWPPACLSPNSRADRRASTATRKAYKLVAFAATRAPGAPAIGPRSTLAITFCPPDRRRRDLDNMLASIKAALDGIAMGAGCDDGGWSLVLARGEAVPGGQVLVEVAA